MKKYILIVSSILLAVCSLQAQESPSLIYYNGLGRSIITASNMDEDSPFLANDTTSERRDLSGQFLFDLGINVEPNEQLRVSTILRVQNEFGGFFSQGSLLQFRQVRIFGVVKDKVSYQIGDIDLKLSPYTLWNSEPSYYEFEADVFGVRRDISHYENFNFGNFWRVQGAQAGFTLLPKKVFQRIDISGFATRIKQTDYLTFPDRLMLGSSINVKAGKGFSAGANVISVFDVIGTSQDTIVDIANTNVEGNLAYNKKSDSKELTFGINGGASSLRGVNEVEGTQTTQTDIYFDASARVKATSSNEPTLTLRYRNVGDRYFAAGAQSRRINLANTNDLFPTGLNGTNRDIIHFDRLSDFDLYNRTITTSLMAYDPIYNNVLPYGLATPNRRGLNLDFQYGNMDSAIYVHAQSDILSEIEAEGVSEKRKFLAIKGGTALNIAHLISSKKLFRFKTGAKYEKTTREGAADIDLSSLSIDAGVEVEFLDNFDFIAGYKSVSGSGNEYMSILDGFNRITRFDGEALYDETHTILSGGLRYRFSDYNHLIFSGNLIDVSNKLNSTLDYTFSQLFINYTLKF